jgi:hypothetical protein
MSGEKVTQERASAYAEAYAAAQPDLGRQVVAVDLEAREIGWEFVPGQAAAGSNSSIGLPSGSSI